MMSFLRRAFASRLSLSAPPRSAAADPLAEAAQAQVEGRFADAAAAYDRAVEGRPDDAGLLVQCGHMHKEAGQFAPAMAAYERAAALTPDDPDLQLQLGHFYKIAGRFADAELAYRRSMELDPDRPDAVVELGGMYRAGWRKHLRGADGRVVEAASELAPLSGIGMRLIPELKPRSPQELLHYHHESVDVRSLGRLEPTLWGELRVLRGVEAIRGYCSSLTPVREMQVKLNGLILFKGPLRGYPFKNEQGRHDLHKWVFNVWVDLSGFEPGRYELELSLHDQAGGLRSWRETVAVGDVVDTPLLRSSDAFVPPFDPADRRLLEDQINTLPSVVRPARRPVFDGPVRSILVLRTDQLGDMVLSVAALKRLRQIFPNARIVGVLTGGNAGLAATLGLFDEIIVIDFPDVRAERRRTMTLEQQKSLAERLAAYDFDIAMDMSESSVSRPLLRLARARFTYGFRDREFAWMDAGFDCNTRDPRNRLERVPHSAKILSLVETLGALLDTRPEVVRREDLQCSRLAGPFGLGEGERYAVMHAGARLEYSRWEGYHALARMILDHTDLKVVMLSDNPGEREALPEGLARDRRFQLVDGKLDFDDFDALLSFATVFVGNDSGPKHMASLRGAPVVSLQMARNNWNEWGQENTGVIVSRRVPCAGCVIQHDPEECGKDYACIRHIRPEEVFGAVRSLI